MKKIKAILNHVIFQFDDDMTKHMGIRQFKDKTDWGFEYAITQESMDSPRWGRIVAVGPDCDPELQPGVSILIDALKWTNDEKINGESYWRTDSDNILVINPEN